MPSYLVTVRKEYKATYRVEAASPEQAEIILAPGFHKEIDCEFLDFTDAPYEVEEEDEDNFYN